MKRHNALPCPCVILIDHWTSQYSLKRSFIPCLSRFIFPGLLMCMRPKFRVFTVVLVRLNRHPFICQSVILHFSLLLRIYYSKLMQMVFQYCFASTRICLIRSRQATGCTKGIQALYHLCTDKLCRLLFVSVCVSQNIIVHVYFLHMI